MSKTTGICPKLLEGENHAQLIAQLKTPRLKSEALRPFLGRYLENPTMNNTNTKI